MKTIIHSLLCAMLLCFAASCSEQVEYRIDESPVYGTFEPVSPMTRTQNCRSSGFVTSDATSDYFQFRDTDRILLCRQDRATGATTILVDCPWPESEDKEILYTYLNVRDNYLYFMKSENEYEWCRVPVDGSAPYEVICTVSRDFLGIYFDTEHTYLYLMGLNDDAKTLVPFDEETGEKGTPISVPDGLSPAFVYEGYVYGYRYAWEESRFYSQLWRYALSGNGQEELVWDEWYQGNIQCMADNGKLYINTMTYLDRAVYVTELDGSNPTRILSGAHVMRIIIHNGTMYLWMEKDGEYPAGIYTYDISRRLLSPLYLSEDVILAPYFTGTGEVWFTTPYTGGGSPFRVGQLHSVSLSGQLRDLSLPSSN